MCFKLVNTAQAPAMMCMLLSVQTSSRTVCNVRSVLNVEGCKSLNWRYSSANCRLMLVQLYRKGAGLIHICAVRCTCAVAAMVYFVLFYYNTWPGAVGASGWLLLLMHLSAGYYADFFIMISCTWRAMMAQEQCVRYCKSGIQPVRELVRIWLFQGAYILKIARSKWFDFCHYLPNAFLHHITTCGTAEVFFNISTE